MNHHEHTCTVCVPDMVPDVAPDDPHYIDAQDPKRVIDEYASPLINGGETPKVRAAYLGPESWAWLFQLDEQGEVHLCPGHNAACMKVVFGSVVVRMRSERLP